MDLLTRAVLNNVAWCGLVSGRGVSDDATGVWLVTGSPPPLFPDAVTLRRGVSADQIASVLSDRRTCSVKDSFADVDLAPHGFRALFTGGWIGCAAPPGGSTGWSRVADRVGLESWCVAADLPEVLPPALLHDPSVHVLATHRDGTFAGGAIANRSAAVVGLSNVFQVDGAGAGVWREVASVVGRHVPGLPVVGYEHGADLDAALGAGFAELGPVRVWLREQHA